MSNKNEPDIFEQMSIFQIMNLLDDPENTFSSEDISKIIDKLSGVKRKKESIEAKKRQQEERERREREAREAKERKEAHIREVTSMDLPLDWENAFNQDVRTQGIHADSISDGLIYSLSNLGRVDIEYISSVTGEDYKTIICALKGSIYQNPETWGECFYKGWETSEEYLSGNMMRKWKAAKDANKEYNGYFADNIRAIEKVLPPTVATKDIYVTLGSPWVPADVIDDFIEYLLGDWRRHWYSINDEEDFHTKHDELTGTWEIPFKSRYNHDVKVTRTYGTDRINALHILERTLNMKSVAVTDEVVCNTNSSGKKRVINQSETILAIEKQNKMIKAFQKWVWEDERRKERLEMIFENNFSCVRRRIFDGSFLRFPDMSPAINLYPYQKDAVARILFTPNTLLAHDVGAGKTYVMIAAAMEMRRMGLSEKNMFVVPNNIVGQWKNIFYAMYPSANILCVEPKSFAPSKRESVLERIRDEDFDGIIIAYSCFEQIPLSKEYYQNQLIDEQELIAEIAGKKNKATSRLKKKQEAVSKALSELAASMDDLYNGVYFDDLGITRLFVDEAHNFKNVPIETKADKVLGINASGSKKCRDMMDKVRMVQKKNDGAGVVFATGTPITNSITDAFIMQMYLQSGELAMLDLQSFDSWIGMFAERSTEFEIDVDTSSYRLATRFSKFHNLPELTSLLSSIADFHQVDTSSGIPQIDGYTDALVSKTNAFADYLKGISQRAEDVRKGYVSRKDDNMLKITTDGRKAALDLRLVDPNAAFTYQSKVARCVENVADIYFRTTSQKSAQIIFCDTSTPKTGFNIYDEVKSMLQSKGVPSDKIAFIHDAETEAQRNTLFAQVRNGDVRVLLGSTFKLGLGVNIQDKLIALHHIDVPWRPADMTQREGRILRQGNTNSKVQIFRYITELDFVMMHEILHVVLQHCIRGDVEDPEAYNIAADIVVNSNIMLENGMKASSITLSKYGTSMHVAPDGKEGHEYTAEQVYAMLPKNSKRKGNKKGAGSSAGRAKKEIGKDKHQPVWVWDDHSQWGKYEEDDTLRDVWVKRFEDAAEAIEIRDSSNTRGLLPAFAQRILKELKKPQTDWRTILNDFIQEEVVDYSFAPPDRRFDDSPFFLPDFNGKEDMVEDILFMIDTSGSILNVRKPV